MCIDVQGNKDEKIGLVKLSPVQSSCQNDVKSTSKTVSWMAIWRHSTVNNGLLCMAKLNVWVSCVHGHGTIKKNYISFKTENFTFILCIHNQLTMYIFIFVH